MYIHSLFIYFVNFFYLVSDLLEVKSKELLRNDLTYVTNASGLNHVKPSIHLYLLWIFHSCVYIHTSIYIKSNISHKRFWVEPCQTIDLFLCVMILTSAERKVGGKHHFNATCFQRQLRKPTREQNAFHIMYAPPIWRLEHVEYVYLKLGDATAYSQSVLQTMLRQRIVMLGYSCN